MLIHPTMLEAMAKSISEERMREADLIRAVLTDSSTTDIPLRAWIARLLLRAAHRLDAHAAQHGHGAVPATGD